MVSSKLSLGTFQDPVSEKKKKEEERNSFYILGHSDINYP
jgi:hypothetical protein